MTTASKFAPEKKIPRDLATFSELPKFISENNIKLFSKEEYTKYDVVNYHLEQKKTDEAFYIVDLGEILEQFKLWKTHLPRVEPFYAVKCCPNPMILRTLAVLGCGFDCASKAEIISVTDLNVPTSRIIYANPVKDPQYIKFARSQNVDVMTFDNEVELYKIKLYHPYAKLVLRIKTDDANSTLKFSSKFGASLADAKTFLEKAKSLELDVIGVSFHVGSRCNDAATFTSSIKDAREIFKMGEALGMKMNLLDVGGGFPGKLGESMVSFEDMAKGINEGIDTYFHDVEDLRVIAEPGRYFASKSHTLVFNVIGKRKLIEENSEPHFQYYMNDGVYGSFNCIIFDGACPEIHPFNNKSEKKYKTTMFGPTCDSLDKMTGSAELPELGVGEWCYVMDFGAYTRASASNFNGFPTIECNYVFTY